MMRRRDRRFAIDARAAVRPELGGVERWARELVRAAARRCGRASTPCCGRRARSRTARATPGSRRVLPLRAARLRRALLCPANLAPVALPAQRRRAPRRRAAAPSRLVLGRLRRVAAAPAPADRPPRAPRDHGLGVLARRAASSCSGSSPARQRRAGRRGRGVLARRRRRPRPRGARPRAARTCCASRPRPRARTSRALVPAARALAGEGVERRRGRRPPAAVRGRARGWTRCGCSATCPTRCCRACTRGRRRSRSRRTTRASGCPVLEAMAAGTPVVAADAAALPETCGGAARLVPPDGEAFRDALLALLGDAAERERLRAAGLAAPRASPGTRPRAASTRSSTHERDGR